MSFSEDPATPAAPFTGDGTVFDHPDVLLQAPTTNERVVDTQSGFLVVIKRMGERLALSCKRCVGTPPSSSILLTQDESLQLAKILANSTVGLEDSANSTPPISASAKATLGARRRFGFVANTGAQRKASPIRRFAKPLIGIGAVALAVAFVGAGFAIGRQGSPAKTDTSIAEADPLATAKVDKFARIFVSDMLDFNPTSYKVSQVQAMSYMSPELLEKYWKETNFPLTKRQLKGLPQGTTVMINKIAQEKIGEDGASVDIYADLVRTDTKLSNPVHIKLKLGLNEEGGIKVMEQEDLTAGIHSAE